MNVGFSLIFVFILTHIFSREEYAIFNVLFTISYLLANSLDFGMTATIYSFVPGLYKQKDDNLYRFLKSSLVYQSIFASIAIVILSFTFPYIDKNFLRTEAPPHVLYMTIASVLLFIWQNFVTNVLFAAKKFFKANLYLNISNIIKTLLLFFLVFINHVNTASVIFVFGIVGPILFFILLAIEKKDRLFLLLKAEVRREEFRVGYTLTYFIATQFYNLAQRMDLFLLLHFGLKAEAGDYGIAQKIILTIITTIVSITQVLSEGFSHITTKREANSHFKTGFMYMLLPCALFTILYFVPPGIYGFLFTEKFVKVAPISRAMSLSFILYSLASVPMLFLLYTVKKPVYILVTNILFFIIVSAGSYLTIPSLGVMGPPYSLFAAFLVMTIIMFGGTAYEYQKLKD
jgi:O-antigen/teichoic acid export membrane protein